MAVPAMGGAGDSSNHRIHHLEVGMDCLVTFILGILTGGFAMALIAGARCGTCREDIERKLNRLEKDPK